MLVKGLATAWSLIFSLILLDNNSIKWKNNIDLFIEKDNFKFEFPKKAKKGQTECQIGNKHNDAKYTRSNMGQAKFGTFDVDGLDIYQKLVDEIKDKQAAKGGQMVKFEKKFLKKYLPTFLKETEKKRKNLDDDGGNKRAKVVVHVEESEFDPDAWDDDSDEDSDEGSDDEEGEVTETTADNTAKDGDNVQTLTLHTANPDDVNDNKMTTVPQPVLPRPNSPPPPVAR